MEDEGLPKRRPRTLRKYDINELNVYSTRHTQLSVAKTLKGNLKIFNIKNFSINTLVTHF